MKIPKSKKVNTGEQERVKETMDAFFIGARKELEERLKIDSDSEPLEFEIKI